MVLELVNIVLGYVQIILLFADNYNLLGWWYELWSTILKPMKLQGLTCRTPQIIWQDMP